MRRTSPKLRHCRRGKRSLSSNKRHQMSSSSFFETTAGSSLQLGANFDGHGVIHRERPLDRRVCLTTPSRLSRCATLSTRGLVAANDRLQTTVCQRNRKPATSMSFSMCSSAAKRARVVASRFLWSRRSLTPTRNAATIFRSFPRKGHAASDVAAELFIFAAPNRRGRSLATGDQTEREGCHKIRAYVMNVFAVMPPGNSQPLAPPFRVEIVGLHPGPLELRGCLTGSPSGASAHLYVTFQTRPSLPVVWGQDYISSVLR